MRGAGALVCQALIVLAKAGKPSAKLVPIGKAAAKRKRIPGGLALKGEIPDAVWFDPLPGDELAKRAFLLKGLGWGGMPLHLVAEDIVSGSLATLAIEDVPADGLAMPMSAVYPASAPPGLVPPDAPAVQLGQDAFERTFGRRPLLVRSGGTLPTSAVSSADAG